VAAIHLPEDESTILGSTANTNIKMGGNLTLSAGSVWMANTNGSERLRITSAGNVGIGTTSPSNLLHLASASPVIRLQDTDGGRAMISCADGNLDFEADADQQVASSRISFRVDDTERARIDSSGRLLVGTSSARSNFYNTSTVAPQLQVEGTTYSTSTLSIVNNNASGTGGYPSLVFGKSAGSSVGSNTAVTDGHYLGEISFQGNDGSEFVDGARITAVVDGTSGANDLPTRLVFSTTADGASSPTERARISQGGAFKASTNGTYFNATATYHEFYQHADATTLVVRGASASTTSDVLSINCDRNTSSSAYNLITASITGVALRFIVRDSGNVLNANNSYTGISDQKLKENIADAGSQWSDIKSLQVRNYNFKEETGQPTHRQIGLIAQEVEQICPGLVDEAVDRDAEGNDLGTVTKSVNYSVLYMKAVKALQEAMERIEQLESEMAAVKAQLS
jgi:hypothetical protein